MGRKYRLVESELRNLIREAITNALGDSTTNPPTRHLENWGGTLREAMKDKNSAESMITTRFNARTAQIYGISDEKMQMLNEVIQNLERSKELLLKIVQ